MYASRAPRLIVLCVALITLRHRVHAQSWRQHGVASALAASHASQGRVVTLAALCWVLGAANNELLFEALTKAGERAATRLLESVLIDLVGNRRPEHIQSWRQRQNRRCPCVGHASPATLAALSVFRSAHRCAEKNCHAPSGEQSIRPHRQWTPCSRSRLAPTGVANVFECRRDVGACEVEPHRDALVAHRRAVREIELGRVLCSRPSWREQERTNALVAGHTN